MPSGLNIYSNASLPFYLYTLDQATLCIRQYSFVVQFSKYIYKKLKEVSVFIGIVTISTFLITKQEPKLATVVFPLTNTGRKKWQKEHF